MSEDPEEQIEVDELLPADLPPADQIMADIQKHEAGWLKDRPKERMLDYALKRMAIIQQRQRVEGSAMMQGWRREWLMMNDVRRLIEWMEQQELERKAEEDRKWKKKK